MSASEVIRRLIIKTELSSRGLARALKLSENAISYYVNGKRRPNVDNCYRIIKFAKKYDMDISLEELLPK